MKLVPTKLKFNDEAGNALVLAPAIRSPWGRLPRPRGDGELGPGRPLGCAHTVRAPNGTMSGVRSRDPALGRSRCHPSAAEGKYIFAVQS